MSQPPGHDPSPPTPTAADIDALAAPLGLRIDSAHRAAVAEHLAGLLAAARLFMDFPLPDDADAAPIFRP